MVEGNNPTSTPQSDNPFGQSTSDAQMPSSDDGVPMHLTRASVTEP